MRPQALLPPTLVLALLMAPMAADASSLQQVPADASGSADPANPFGSCPWFDVNIPESLFPPVEVYPECLLP